MTGTKPLSFRDVDGLGFAASANDLDTGLAPVSFAPKTLGPLLEFLHLQAGQRVPKHPEGKSWLASNGSAPLISALQRGDEHWASSTDRRMGFIRALRGDATGNSLISFLMNASTAACDIAGLPGTVPRQLAAAMQELENNIHEHSEAADTGLLAYRAAPGVFEFVAADRAWAYSKVCRIAQRTRTCRITEKPCKLHSLTAPRALEPPAIVAMDFGQFFSV